MARTWLSIQVELVEGMHAHDLWPRPARVLVARPGMTFRELADAINLAFARWDRAHLHAFTLQDGTRVEMRTPWDELDDGSLDDTRTKLSRLELGEQFVFEFDFGDSWMHLCTVADRKVDPTEVYGELPDRPVSYEGWGQIPDQHGRRWADDDGSTPLPPQPDPPLSDLPDLHHTWGSRAFSVPPADDRGTVVPGPWSPHRLVGGDSRPSAQPWSTHDVTDLRSAVRRWDGAAVIDLLLGHDPLPVAHHAAPALLDAVATRDPDAMAVAVELAERLSERGWLGDDELVREIDHALVPLAEGGLPPVPVDLEELIMHLDGPDDPEGHWRLELVTGRFWPADPEGLAGIDEPADFDDPDAFVTIVSLGSKPGYGDMRDFIATVDDAQLAERLRSSIEGKGAFRRFRDVVHQDDELRDAWTQFSSERQLARARWWLADAGFRPAVVEP